MSARTKLRDTAVALARAAGYTVTRASNSLAAKRMQLLKHHDISVVLDVGANVGDYGRLLRGSGYAKRIVSFEPTSGAFAHLSSAATIDPLWDARQTALGDVDGTASINLSAASACSSLLAVTATSVNAAPQSVAVGEETISVCRLDSIGNTLPAGRLYVKLDVQGFELSVLRGAKRSLSRVMALECEVSFVALYEGQALAGTMLNEFAELGFDPVWLERGFLDPTTGFMLQADVLFSRRGL